MPPRSRTTLLLHSVAPDLNPPDAPAEAWNSANNVIFRNGETIPVATGLPAFTGGLTTALALIYTEINASPYWVYAGKDGVFATDGSAHFDITPASWNGTIAARTVWTACVLGGLVVINRSDDDPVWWSGDPASACTKLPGWIVGARCIAMRAHKNFLFAIGRLDVDASLVSWSDAAEAGTIPATWVPAADNLAGDVVLMAGVDPCIDGLTLRDSFIIYKGQSIWSLDFTGDPSTVFASRKMFDNTGLASTNAVAGDHTRHLYIDTSGDVFETNGVEAASVLDGRAKSTFYTDLDEFSQGKCSSAMLVRENSIVLAYPRTGDGVAMRAVSIDLSSGDIGFHDVDRVKCMATGRFIQAPGSGDWDDDPDAWKTDKSAWNEAFSGATKDDVISGGDGGFTLLGAGDTLAMFAQKMGMAFGNPDRRKLVSRLWPKVTGTEGRPISLRVGGQETPGGPVSWNASQIYLVGQDAPIDVMVTGRYLAIELDADPGDPFRVSSFDVTYVETGRW